MAKSSRTSRDEQSDAIELLLEDHKKVQKLFKDFEKAQENEEDLQGIAENACMELKVHSMLEKEIFYPAIREEIDEGEEDEDLLNEAQVEHETVDELIEKIEGLESDDPMFAAHFTVLAEYVRHHVKEEEKEMFPRVKKLKGLDLEAIGEEMRERKQSLMRELGAAEGEDEGAEIEMEQDEDEVVAEGDDEQESSAGSRRSSRANRR